MFKKPGKKLLKHIEARLRLWPTFRLLTHNESKKRLYQLNSFKSLPGLEEAPYLISISSVQRNPHLRMVDDDYVIINDTLMSDTIMSLEVFNVAQDRPLVPWTYFQLLISEHLFGQGQQALALALAESTYEYIDNMRDEDGRFSRPMLISYTARNEVRVIEKLFSYFTAFHELGHFHFQANAKWRARFEPLKKILIDPIYQSIPLDLDRNYGLNVANRQSKKKRAEIATNIISAIMEEIASDLFTLLVLVANRDILPSNLNHSVCLLFNFWLYSDLLDTLKYETGLWARNRLRIRSVQTNLAVRMNAILAYLEDPGKINRKLFEKSIADDFNRAIRSLEVNLIVPVFRKTLQTAGALYTSAFQIPSPLEHPGEPWIPVIPTAMRQLQVKCSKAMIQFWNKVFGDHIIKVLHPNDVPSNGEAPHIQIACHALIRARIWTFLYNRNDESQKSYEMRVSKMNSKKLLETLRIPSAEVRGIL